MSETPDPRAAIVAEAIAWATARRDHWALVQSTYRETGLPSKPAEATLIAAEARVIELTRRLEALALEAKEVTP